MTESEAAKKCCPFGRYGNQTETHMLMCIASKCMAWKFDRPKKTFLGFTDEEWGWIDKWIIDNRFTPSEPILHGNLRMAAAQEIRKRNITVPALPNTTGKCQLLKGN